MAGNPESEWQISGAGDLSIQGFATDISYNKGQAASFKIKTNASGYSIKIYRLGYYRGNGARYQGDATVTATLPQTQLPCQVDPTTGLLDCGNWSESANWQIPTDAVSGVYIAKLTRSDNGGSSHIVFIVRDDTGNSDLLFQTSDATWQAYNIYGDNSTNGKSLYAAVSGDHAYKVSYNRPFITRNGGGGGGASEDWLFNAEYPMIRWLEANGYNVSYSTDVDTDRRGNLLTSHKVFMSVGHDEYWSGTARANVTAARNAGKHVAFFSGNEIYWKTRWEDSHRTLVCYKEGTEGDDTCGGKCDPISTTWTGLWRSGCNFSTADGCRPENELSGQISWTNAQGAITVPASYKNLRFWRNTSVASLTSGAATFTDGTLGYEWDPRQDAFKDSYPAGQILLSQTSLGGATHQLSLYKHSSGALVFGAGTVQWSWGLDSHHDRGSAAPDKDMKQATVNLFADMGVQPATLESGLTAASASSDTQAPTVAITAPTGGASLPSGQAVTVSGTASDANTVAGVEISTDGGTKWQRATGTTSWTYSWTPSTQGPATIQSRAFDDSGNMSAPVSVSVSIGTGTGTGACPCTVFQPTVAPTGGPYSDNGSAIQLGMKFQASTNGYITGVRFYKQSSNTGTHIGQLYNSTGTLLAQSTFTNETATGWQQVAFTKPVAITAGTTYVISYHSSTGYYSADNTGFAQAVVNGPLRGLASTDPNGPNGVYKVTGTPAFPTDSYQSSNYYVDVVFDTAVGPDTSAPTVLSTSPANNAASALATANITVTFDEAVDPATVSGTTVQLLNGTSPVAATVTYDAISRTATLDPTATLSYSTAYTISVKGGASDPRIKDLAGIALAATFTSSFTTQGTPPPPPAPLPSPNEGPGGPILVISSSANPFSRFPIEILRAEGFNEFAAKDISQVDNTTLSSYDVVILGDISLSAANVTMLTDWVTAGGTLIALKPNAQLAPLLGITATGGTLLDKYLLVNTASGPGVGIVGETMQFHGTADLYTLNSGTTSLAMLYSSATTATSNPAVTQRAVGTNGGKAIAFTYDLARSIVYTRQGNPAWAGQKRDGAINPIRSDDMFHSNDPISTDWVDMNKVAIPQADEQQRLLANIMEQGSKKPLPRFWYLPKGLKAAVVMSGDDHGSGGTKNRFDSFITKSSSNTAQAVADWTAVRGTSYIYPGTPITDAQAAAYEAQGFELSLHLNTGCNNWTPTSLRNDFTTQLGQWTANFPSLTKPVTHRTHCIAWSDWASEPKIELENGIRLDDNYYYWPEAWVKDRPGMFTGSGIPMRFADLDGSLIDVYQATTQLTDESGITIATHINTLLDNAIGSKGYYGVFTANMHTDFDQTSIDGSNAIIAAAQQRQIPVVSAKQMLTWLDGRNNSSFGAMAWNANKLSFSVSVFNNVLNLQGMLPIVAAGGRLTGLTVGGAPVTYRTESIKGMDYAFFPATPGSYVATYDGAVTTCTPPTATIAAVEPTVCPGSPVALKLSAATGQSPYKLVVNGTTYSDVTVGQTFATFTPGEVSIWGATGTPDNPNAHDTHQTIEVGTKFRASTSGTVTGMRFFKGTNHTGTHVGSLWTTAGAKLATATFTNETASGWQEVHFSTPVAITAGTTYIVSYTSPGDGTTGGGFAYSAGFFTNTGVTNGSLTALQSGTDGPNGVYKYGGGFPDGGTAANYWVDVLFKDDAANGPQNYVLTSITDANACNATGTSLSSATVTPGAAPAGTLAASGAVQAGQDINLTFTATAGTGPFALVINGTNYPNVTSGTPFNTGVKAATSGTNSIWSSSTVPSIASFVDDNSSIELGVKFRSTVAGQITGVRFYKGTTNTGTHTGSLWSSAGVLLATATFTNETASGWQEVLFSSPVTIVANTTYIASYHAPVGNYAVNSNYFATTGTTNGPLKALQSSEDGGNGVFQTGTAFPNQSFNATNYWVDVVFTATGGNTFSLTSVTDSKGCVKQGPLQTLTVQPTAATNAAPVLAAIGNKTATVGTALTFTATATDGDQGQTLAFSLAGTPAAGTTPAGTVPANATIDPTTGAFSWTPTAAQVGSFSFLVRVSDNGSPVLSDDEVITVTVAQPQGTAQTITFAALPDVTTSAGPITLAATASSGLPVTYSATGPATVSGSTLTLAGTAGTVTVTATQAGDATYAAAAPVSHSFNVTAGAAATACFQDQTVANFTDGTTGTGTYIPAAGGVILKPQVAQEFTAAPPATEWQSFSWTPGSGGTTFAGGQAIVDG
ncbi:DUF4082 domain-containing protein, partial [Hymenobacter sp. BT770]